MDELSQVLTALYLRGAPAGFRLRRAGWTEVLRVLRRAACPAEGIPEALRRAGLWAEALAVECPGVMEWAQAQIAAERVLTGVDPGYPYRWLRVLGGSAPPALWRRGRMPLLPSVSVVGSRRIPREVAQFAEQVGSAAVGLGFCVVSGRAEGCDRAAAAGARGSGGEVVEILPYGIDLAPAFAPCVLSVCPPSEPFTAAAAMERNALIYAASSHTVVAHARFKEGGAWAGATQALRSRLCTVIVRASDDLAHRALVGLGGVWLNSPPDLSVAMKAAGPQGALFDSAV